MSLNWKELELILSELPLEGSYIQKITEHSVSSFTFSMFSKTEKAWLLYAEVATPYARVCRTGIVRKKDRSMQRFTQYMNAHIVGKRVESVQQYPFDRAFVLKLRGSDGNLMMHIRLYTGPGANIIITDEDGTILELLYRRPHRHEEKGEKLIVEKRSDEGPKSFSVRSYDTPTFNEFIDRTSSVESSEERKKELEERIREKRDRELGALRERLARQERRLRKARSSMRSGMCTESFLRSTMRHMTAES